MEFSGSIERVLAGVKDPIGSSEYIHFVLSAASLVGAKTICFLHIVEDLSELNIQPDPGRSAFETLLHSFTKKVKETARAFPDLEVECDIREGEKDKLLLHWIKVQQANLLILGRRLGKLNSGSRSIKITRLAPCHVLLIPENSSWKPISKALLPVDFSDYSELGIKAISRIPNLHSLTCLNIYEVPSGYYYSGVTEEEAEAKMLQNARDAWDKFKKIMPSLHPGIVPAFILKKSSIADDIQKFIQNEEFNLIVIGSKGLSGTVGFMLGSVSQEFIREFYTLPVLIVKNREERLSLIDALIS